MSVRETRAWDDALPTGSKAPPPNELVGKTVGSYKVTSVLGQGGVGTVYLGEHPVIGSRVAIKVLRDDLIASKAMVERFIQEARAANLIASEHICKVNDFGRLEDGRHFAVMEYLSGHPLDSVMKQGSMSLRRAARILRQTAEAMAAAHTAGIIHRDLKPENLFVEQRSGGDFVRILDFGVAKLMDPRRPGHHTTQGLVLGTPLYCSPEQAAGDPVGPTTDIYSLGAIAYEVLGGTLPYKGNVVEILVQKTTRDVPPLIHARPDLPPELCALVDSMLARQAQARPSTMSALAEAFGRFETLTRWRQTGVHPLSDIRETVPTIVPADGIVEAARRLTPPQPASSLPLSEEEIARVSTSRERQGDTPTIVDQDLAHISAARSLTTQLLRSKRRKVIATAIVGIAAIAALLFFNRGAPQTQATSAKVAAPVASTAPAATPAEPVPPAAAPPAPAAASPAVAPPEVKAPVTPTDVAEPAAKQRVTRVKKPVPKTSPKAKAKIVDPFE